MRLKEITTPQEGFVYRRANGKIFYVETLGDDCIHSVRDEFNKREKLHEVDFGDLIILCEFLGAINITHEIKDGKLVEIPRGEIEVGDIITDKTYIHVITWMSECKRYVDMIDHTGRTVSDFNAQLLVNAEKIGIYDVHKTFVNSKE